MAKKMLIDATHAEETRVVVVDGNKVEEFDFESENKRQLAGNIYLAKVTRVEPSLQAAFVDYGGNRHGFLAFSEIHPDYYQIPVADREALLAEEMAEAEEEAREEEKPKRRSRSRSRAKAADTNTDDAVTSAAAEGEGADADELADAKTAAVIDGVPGMDVVDLTEDDDGADAPGDDDDDEPKPYVAADDASERDDNIESVADDDTPDDVRPRRKPRAKKYKIQEVIKVRQILLVQVVKEERGNKGAALTTYLSLAGRYCVLMPNTARGGGISRKITNAADRKKLKEIATSIEVPKGAGLIIRTAGAKRTKTEIKRDYEYLQRMWEQIRALTLQSIAPAPIYEEGNLIKRSIRDLYNREIDEVLVEGEVGYRVAKDFMKMIMPSHAKNVKNYHDQMPLFARHQVESYLGGMFNPTVQPLGKASISSRTRVPPRACSSSGMSSPPAPNRCAESVSSSWPAQENRTNLRPALAPTACRAWATSVLPVPVSPSIRTCPSAWPRSRISSRRRSITGDDPISFFMMPVPSDSSRRRARLSSVRRRLPTARLASSVMRSGLKGFSRKSKAPTRMASTAMGTSPCPVIMMTGNALSTLIRRLRNCIPSMPGILMSLTTTPG